MAEIRPQVINVPTDGMRHALRVMRVSRGVTQAELSAKSGLARTHIASVESGKRPLSLGTLATLTSALDYSVALSFKPRKKRKS